MCFIIGWNLKSKIKKSVFLSSVAALYDRGGEDGVGVASKKIIKSLYLNNFIASLLKKNILGVSGIMHGRYATQGAVSLFNVQPFRISRGLWGVHNGQFLGLGDNKQSDSFVFFKQVNEQLKQSNNIARVLRDTINNNNIVYSSYAILIYNYNNDIIYGVHNNGNMHLHRIPQQGYLMASDDISDAVSGVKHLGEVDINRVFYFTAERFRYLEKRLLIPEQKEKEIEETEKKFNIDEYSKKYFFDF